MSFLRPVEGIPNARHPDDRSDRRIRPRSVLASADHALARLIEAGTSLCRGNVEVFRHFLLGSVLAVAPMCVSAATETVQLEVHEQHQIALPAGLERIAIADPGVADIVSLKGRRDALLVGNAPGRTTLLMWVRGQAEPERTTILVQSAVQGALLADQPDMEVTSQNGVSLLSGSAPSLLDHERARAAAAAAGDGKQAPIDVSTVASGGVVQVDVKVVEFNRTALRQIGLNIIKQNGGFTFGLFGPSQLGSATANDAGGIDIDARSPISSAFNLVARSATHNWFGNLSLLQNNGMARVLAEPTLVALSGQSASFLAGGELPIPVPQGLGTTTIEFKPFGIGLTVTPTVLSPDRIALKVAPEASDLDYGNALIFGGVQIPSITTRRADTTVELGDGESYVIGGLVSSSTSTSVNKVPLLGDIPIIGAFFRDLNQKRVDKELVIIVTPHLVRPIARGATLPLPGERESDHNQPVWGAWLLGPASSDQLPGFSR